MDALQLTNSQSPFFEAQLDGLARAGVDCTVATVEGTPKERSPLDYVRFYPAVLSYAANDFDVVHANYGLLGPVALAQPRRPVVLTLWGSDVMGEHALVTRASRFAARYADAVVAPSNALARALPVDSTVIPFGVDTHLFRPIPRDEARREVGWDSDARVVLFPYDPERPEKNYSLAEAVVARAREDVQLRTITGVPYERMPYYLNACDALLVTSRREAGPMTVKEAAACNVPVVSTDVGFVSEVLDGVEHSYVGTNADDLAAALDEVFSAGERSNGRDVVDVLSIEEMGTALRRLYESVC